MVDRLFSCPHCDCRFTLHTLHMYDGGKYKLVFCPICYHNVTYTNTVYACELWRSWGIEI
jgi:hypothetical protein